MTLLQHSANRVSLSATFEVNVPSWAPSRGKARVHVTLEKLPVGTRVVVACRGRQRVYYSGAPITVGLTRTALGWFARDAWGYLGMEG